MPKNRQPKIIPVIVDSVLRCKIQDVPDEVGEFAVKHLTLPNEEKRDKKMRNIQGWQDLEDDIIMYEFTDDDEFIMPRGYALQFKQLARNQGYRVKWIDYRTWNRRKPFGKDEFSYRVHQPDAVDSIIHHQQGIYTATTGSGKTVTFCGAIWELRPSQSLILVNRIELVDQWRNRLAEHIGIPRSRIGKISDGEWSVVGTNISVASVQTLWSHRDRLDAEDWWSLWDFVVLDEVHHATAHTFKHIISRFPAKHRHGTSATPDKTGNFKLAEYTVGPVHHEDSYEYLKSLGILVQPEVEIVPTNFSYQFWGDHRVKAGERCKVPGCKIRGRAHGHRNNYQKMLSALERDPERNDQIAEKILEDWEEGGHTQIVISDHTTQLSAIMDRVRSLDVLVQNRIKMVSITGKDTGKRRQQILGDLERGGNAVLFSTVAGEGLDLPVIDRVHLVFPGKNSGNTIQKVGRSMRTVEGKDTAIVYDYVDKNVNVFKTQARARMKGAYKKLGFEINGEISMPESSGLGGVLKDLL